MWMVIVVLLAACSVKCQRGEYEASACGRNGNHVCKDCRNCSGSSYEARPCGTESDRQCIHAAYPLLITSRDTTKQFIEGLKVESSDNVFLENLHAMKGLDTRVFVADTTQASDFYWVRDSKLKINIGVNQVQLIPRFDDVQHRSDNAYMRYPNRKQAALLSQDRRKFNDWSPKFCSHPIPDSYSITLEVSRDRITEARKLVCDSTDPKSPECPPEVQDGDTFVYRTLNKPCTRMGTFPKKLESAANALGCTSNSLMLSKIFNRTFQSEREITFPSQSCKVAIFRCNQCLGQARCNVIDKFEQKCCQRDCYILKECKMAHSPSCLNADVKCASGDTYLYTIQPIFSSIQSQFQCHVRHRPSKILYRLFFYFMLPEFNFKTARDVRTIPSGDVSQQSRGTYKADYLTVEHNTGIKLRDEFVLVGREWHENVDFPYNFTLYKLKKAEDFGRKKIPVTNISNNIQIAQVQFTAPFAYSTASWSGSCDKNVSTMRAAQPIFREDEPQHVEMTNKRDDLKPAGYYLKSLDNPPYLRFTVPANTSVLRWYFNSSSPYLYTDGSLNVSLQLIKRTRIWNIRVSGTVSDTPAFFSVVINNMVEMLELFRYDAIVFAKNRKPGPTNFSLSFMIPNWGQVSDKTFGVEFRDPHKTYNVFLTHMHFREGDVGQSGESPAFRTAERPVEPPLSALGVLVVVCLLFLGLLYAYVECSKSRRGMSSRQLRSRPIRTRRLSRSQLLFLAVYVSLRVAYSLLFSFTLALALLVWSLAPQLDRLSGLPRFQLLQQNATGQLRLNVARHGQRELLRQAEHTTRMQSACSNYVSEIFEQMHTRMHNASAHRGLSSMYGSTSSISNLLERRLNRRLQQYRREVNMYRRSYLESLERKVRPYRMRFRSVLKRIFRSSWFVFAQSLFNQSEPQSKPNFQQEWLSGPTLDFARFLNARNVHSVLTWQRNLNERLIRLSPRDPRLPTPTIRLHRAECDHDPGARLDAHVGGPFATSERLDTSRYMSPSLTAGVAHFAESDDFHAEYRFLSPDRTKGPDSSTRQFAGVSGGLEFGIVRLVLLALDIFLFVYRTTRTFIIARVLARRGFHVCKWSRQPSNKSLSPPNQANSAAPSVSMDSPAPPPPPPPPPPPSSLASTLQREKLQSRIGRRLFCALRSDQLPKLLLGAVLLLTLVALSKLAHRLLDAELIRDTNAFSTFLEALHAQVNQTNEYLNGQADYLNQVSLRIYRRQMDSELRNLHSLLAFFNLEQKRLVRNYVAEACALHSDVFGATPCDIRLDPATLNIPVLPCNFVPVVPKKFSGLDRAVFEAQFSAQLEPFLSACRRVVRVTCVLATVVISVAVLSRLLGRVVFHWLRTRRKFRVRTVYVSRTPPPAGRARLESDSDEPEHGGFRTTRVRLAPHSRTETLLTEVRYSETKV